jgi:hypothetical protein
MPNIRASPISHSWRAELAVYQGFKLGQWVQVQKSSKVQLTPDRLVRLDDLGFIWDSNSFKWEEGFNHLVAYKKEFGSCSVAQGSKYRNYSLGNWVSNQKSNKDKLSLERVSHLDELGFVWKLK